MFVMPGHEAQSAEFARRFADHFNSCDWAPHPLYSVFTQYDAGYYLARRGGFERKYRSMWAVARTISPQVIVELGTHAGSSADAYISATRGLAGRHDHAHYIGYDLFGISPLPGGSGEWNPRRVCEALFADRGFHNWRLSQGDLRTLTAIEPADFVVVDAAHDLRNAWEDLQLALTASPRWLFVDDVSGFEVQQAIELLLEQQRAHILFTFPVDYPDKGLVIRLAD